MALQFTKTATNGVEIADYAAVRPSGSATWCAWVRRNGTMESYSAIFGKQVNGGASQPYVSWGFGQDGDTDGTLTKIYTYVGTAGTIKPVYNLTLVADTWTHVLATWDASGGILALYGDGTSVASTNHGAASMDYSTGANGKVNIGASPGGTAQRSNCEVAECAFWDVLLTAGEISALAKGFSPTLVRAASLKLYAPMVRNAYEAMTATATTVSGSPPVTGHPRMIYPRRRAAFSVAAAAPASAVGHYYRTHLMARRRSG